MFRVHTIVAKRAHASKLLAFLQEIYPLVHNPRHKQEFRKETSKPHFKKYVDWLCQEGSNKRTWLVLDDKDEIIASAAAELVPSKYCKMMAFYVKPKFQNAGIGRALLEQVVAFAGTHSIRIEVVHYQADTLRYYTRLGFQKTGEPEVEQPWEASKEFIRDHRCVVMMRKPGPLPKR